MSIALPIPSAPHDNLLNGRIIPILYFRIKSVRSIEYHGSSRFTSNGPKSTSTCTLNLPFHPSGARHEHRQTPPQPYLNRPLQIVLPASFTMVNPGAGNSTPFRVMAGLYLSPFCPSMVRPNDT